MSIPDLLKISPAQAASSIGVFFCSICNKPFSQEGALNRHVPYCRRARNRPRVRPKPCRDCKAAKSKCSLQTRCARCVKKGLDCIYAETGNHGYGEDAGTLIPVSTTPRDTSSQRYFSTDPLFFPNNEQQFWSPYPQVSGFPADLLFDSLPGLSMNTGFSSVTVNDADLILPRHIHQNAVTGISNDNIISPPMQISFPLASVRPASPIAENSAKVIRQSLIAYPQMMLRRSTFPPFIHPYQDKNHLPEPLANCMGIAVLFVSRNDDTRPFLWKAIREEQQRCLRETPNYSKHEVFAALQAELIYITMRVADGCGGTYADREYNIDMLFAYEALWTRFIMLDGATCNMNPSDSTFKWEDWILDESRARIACVWFMVAQVSSVKVGPACAILDTWRDLPLPCHKAQWTATSPDAWKEETEALHNLQKRGRTPVTFGDLLECHRRADEKASAESLDAWNAGADNIGLLLNLVTTMM